MQVLQALLSRRCPALRLGAAALRLVLGIERARRRGPRASPRARSAGRRDSRGSLANSRKIDDRDARRVAASRFGSAVHTRNAATSVAIWSTVGLVPVRIGHLPVASSAAAASRCSSSRNRDCSEGSAASWRPGTSSAAPARLVLVAGQQRIDVGRAALARLGDQRQVGRKRIVVGRARRDFVGERRRESVGRQRLAGRRLAGVRVDRRNLGLPVRRDLLDLGVVVAKPLEVAERDQLEAVAGRADLRVDLEAALQLRLVELAERTVAGEVQRLRLLVEFVRGERRRRIAEIGRERR